ncbi:MAG: hypothetical protein ACK4NC_01615 [Candidatus Gracilibacteria bacterium]
MGFFILFLQLYALASSMYRDSQLNEQIKEFRADNDKKKTEISNKKVEYISTQLDSTQIRYAKESEDKLYKDEQMKIINNSAELAHNNLQDISDSPTFASPSLLTLEDDHVEQMKAIKKQTKIDQWKYYFFHIE